MTENSSSIPAEPSLWRAIVVEHQCRFLLQPQADDGHGFSTHDVRRVIYGIDLEALTYFYKRPNAKCRITSYDDNLLNDVAYWFTVSVLTNIIPKCLLTLGQSDPNQIDTMYVERPVLLRKDAALAEIEFSARVSSA